MRSTTGAQHAKGRAALWSAPWEILTLCGVAVTAIAKKGKDRDGFREFAQAFAGMTYRECDAITAKLHWHMVRAGHVGYHDELGDSDDDED